MDLNKKTAVPASLRNALPYIILCGVILLLYLKTVFFGFVHYDDNRLILQTRQVFSGAHAFLDVFSHNVFFDSESAYYRPLLSLSFLIDHRLWGVSPAGYHLTNLLLHAAVSVALYLLLLRFGHGKRLSLFLALVFAVHPLFSDAVAWVPGRNDLLLALFVILSFGSFMEYAAGGSRRRYGAHLLFFACALLTKENGVVLPAACLLYLWLMVQKKPAPARWLALVAGWSAVLLGYFAARHLVIQGHPDAMEMFRYMARDWTVSLRYWGSLAVPVHVPLIPRFRDLSSLYGPAALLLTAGALFFSPGKRPRAVAFGAAWFLLFLLPTLVIYQSFYQGTRMCVPVIGFFIVLAETRTLFARSASLARILPYAGAAVLLVLAGLTFQRSDAFRSRLSFWKTAASESPDTAEIHLELGTVYLQEYGAVGMAEREYGTAVECDPRLAPAYRNLAVIYEHERRYADEIQALRTYLSLVPSDARAGERLSAACSDRQKNDIIHSAHDRPARVE